METTETDHDPCERLKVESMKDELKERVLEHNSLQFVGCRPILENVCLFKPYLKELPRSLFKNLLGHALFVQQMDGLIDLLSVSIQKFDKSLCIQANEKIDDGWIEQLANELVGSNNLIEDMESEDRMEDEEFGDDGLYQVFPDLLDGCFDMITTIDLSGSISITDYSLKLLSQGCVDGNLRRLYLNNCTKLTGVYNNEYVTLPDSLTVLSLENCGDFSAVCFENLYNLVYLNINRTNISGGSLDFMSGLKKLRTLLWSANGLSSSDCMFLFSALPDLECLDISANDDLTYVILEPLSKCLKMKKLNISCAGITFSLALEKLVVLENLQHLAIYCGDVTSVTESLANFREKRRQNNLCETMVYYADTISSVLETLQEFAFYDDYSSTTAAGSAFVSQLFHHLMGPFHEHSQIPQDTLVKCLQTCCSINASFCWTPVILTLSTFCIAQLITYDELQDELLSSNAPKVLIRVMIQLSNAQHLRKDLALYTLFALCNLALQKENRVILDQLRGTKLVYEVMSIYSSNLHNRTDALILEYGCHSIANMNWPSTEFDVETACKIVDLVVDTLYDPLCSEGLVGAILNALRNLTCDASAITEFTASKKALTILSKLITENYNIMNESQEELARLQLESQPPSEIQPVQARITSTHDIIFATCSLLWNVSENDKIRMVVFQNCFESLTSVTKGFETNSDRIDLDITYFILMIYSNLINNTDIKREYPEQAKTLADTITRVLEHHMKPEKRIKTEWGSFEALFKLLQYDPKQSQIIRQIEEASCTWSAFVFTNLSFRKSYHKRLVLEGGLKYALKALQLGLPAIDEYIASALNNFALYEETIALTDRSLWKQCLHELSARNNPTIQDIVERCTGLL